MADITEVAHTGLVCLALVAIVFFFSRCQASADEQNAKTQQAAIQAGMHQDQLGHWVK